MSDVQFTPKNQYTAVKISAGDVFNNLTVLRSDGKKGRKIAWICRCVCLKETRVSSEKLRSGRTKSCGCTHPNKRTHGETVNGAWTTEYATWASMIARCTNPKNDAYKYYGARGISVCVHWLRYENFLADMGRKPAGLSIDRIDNNAGYFPGNCKWATNSEQALNRRPKGSCG